MCIKNRNWFHLKNIYNFFTLFFIIIVMNKYLIITVLTLSLFSCNKEVSVDGVNINTSSWLNVTTQEWSVGINENGVQIMTNEGTAAIWEKWLQTQVDGIGTMNVNETGIQWNVDWVGEIGVTNNGITAGKVNISSGNVAESVISDAMNQEMNNMDIDMNMDGLDDMMNDALESTN